MPPTQTQQHPCLPPLLAPNIIHESKLKNEYDIDWEMPDAIEHSNKTEWEYKHEMQIGEKNIEWWKCQT